jgi:GH24 family phage-related lysozyme (muramidase)
MVVGILNNIVQTLMGMKVKEEKVDLGVELEQAKKELSAAYQHFNQAQSDKMVESSIYEIKAIEYRYSHLLRKMKEEEKKREQQQTVG